MSVIVCPVCRGTFQQPGEDGIPCYLCCDGRSPDSFVFADHDFTQEQADEATALHVRYRGASDSNDFCAHCNRLTGSWIAFPCPTVIAVAFLRATGDLK